ncbi:MAG: hypothetical protein ACRDNF_17530 [Streptosporangiaceae bacterium]
MRIISTRRTFAALAALALCAASPAIASARTSATPTSSRATAAAGACKSKTKGVTEVVDFTNLGGTIEVACDTGKPKTGLAALTGAGFHYAFVKKYPGFICRIDGLPDPCNGAPASAYWSYWHAPQGGSWKFSDKGAGDYDPKQGSVQGWAFGADKAPGMAPPG